MGDKTRQREREAEATTADTRLYEPKLYEYVIDELDRAMHGRIIIHAKERLWDVHRQANSKRYLSPHEPDLDDTATHQWEVFLQIFPDRSGKHRHQGVSLSSYSRVRDTRLLTACGTIGKPAT